MKVVLISILVISILCTSSQDTLPPVLTKEDVKENKDILSCMALVHYYFGDNGNAIADYIKKQNISTEIVVERFTNKMVKECLNKTND